MPGNPPHDSVRNIHFKYFFEKQKDPGTNGSLRRIFIVSHPVGPLSYNNGFDYSLLQPIRISSLRISFDGGAFESSRSEKVDTHSAFIIYDSSRLLFSICPMAEDPFAQGVDWYLKGVNRV